MASVAVLVFFSIFVGSLSASPPSSSTEAMKAIDRDGNGKVSLQEIEAFGRTSGLSAKEIRADFKDLDSNSDGELDTQEMSGLLPATASAEAPPSANAEPVFIAKAAEPVFLAKAKPFLRAKAEAKPESIATADARLFSAAKATPVFAAKAEPVLVAEAKPVLIAKTEPATAAEATLATAAKAEPALPMRAGVIASAVKEQVPGLEALELDARRQAGAIIAEGLAKRAEAAIQQGEKDKKEAEFTEAKAVALRGSARSATNWMFAKSLVASEAAVNAAAKQGLVEAERLKRESEELEREARQHHERAKQALLQASQAQES